MARYGTDKGLRVALATNGTLVTKHVARMIVDSGVRRVAISLDGADALTHDSFRGIPGAFDAAIAGFRNLKNLGMSVQINTTIARHNAHQLPHVLELAKSLGADALHTFLLVPVGCGVDIAAEQMVPPEEYEKMLNWFYDRSLEGGIEMKATCAPHYFRVVRQRRVAERRSAEAAAAQAAQPMPTSASPSAIIGPTEMVMPGSTGIELKPHGIGHASGTPGNSPFGHERHDQGMPGRNCSVFHLASGRGFSLWIFASLGRRSEKAIFRRHLGELRGIQSTPRCQQPERQMRLL